MSDLDRQKRKRRLLLWLLGVSVGFVPIAVIAIPFIYLKFFFDPFEGFSGPEEFTRLSSSEARARLAGEGGLRGGWPNSVDPNAVEWLSYKCQSTIDSHSCWLQIKLTREAAAKWADWAHAKQRAHLAASEPNLYSSDEVVEGTISDAPPRHHYTGDSPPWWRPPPRDWRATERISWYKDTSGDGSGTYSSFDPSTSVLWIFNFSTQHFLFWPRGSPPKVPTDPIADPS